MGYLKAACTLLIEVQAAFYFSGSLHPQRIHNQLKHIRMPAAAGVIEVKRFVSHSILRQQLDQVSRIECIRYAHMCYPRNAKAV